MPSTINATPTSSGLVQSADASGVLALQTGGTTAVTIDASQNVGIGTSSPVYKLDVRPSTGLTGAGIELFRSGGLTSGNGGVLNFRPSLGTTTSEIYNLSIIAYDNNGDSNADGLSINGYDGVSFCTGSSTRNERMRIDTSGNLLVGTTGISTGTFKGFQNGTSNSGGANYLSQNPSGTSTRQWSFGMNNSDQYVVYGYNNTSFNTGAYIAWGGTSWTAQSDERTKDIIEPITDALDKVSTLRTVIGKYKTDEEDTRRAFLIAQDVQKVLPEAVDATDPEKLGVQYTDVIPLLVASIKELNAKVDAQAAEIQALKDNNTPLPADVVTDFVKELP